MAVCRVWLPAPVVATHVVADLEDEDEEIRDGSEGVEVGRR